MAYTEKTISGLIESQLPDFINAKYQESAPSFRRFIELYYTWLEDSTEGNTVYHIMNSEKYRDIDEIEESFLTYFKNELLPYFPERTELELVKILKGAKEFYQKKGTENSIEWLFRVLFNKEAIISYPRDNILRASDGKWQLPVALKVSDTPFLIQSASSTKNYFAPRSSPTEYYSGNTYSTAVEFSNNIRKNSTIIAFTSYKIWVNSAISPATLKTRLTDYIANNESSIVSDAAGSQFISITNSKLVSDNFSGYGASNVCFQIVEAFYNQSIDIENSKIITFKNKLTPFTIESILQLGTDQSYVKVQFDGIEAFEIGDLQKNGFISSNAIYAYSSTSTQTILNIDGENTPCYILSFGKEELGNPLFTDSANNTTLANTYFGDNRYSLQYTKKYYSGNVASKFTSAASANIATISFAFKEEKSVPLKLLERRQVVGEVSRAKAVVEKVFTRVDEYTKSKYSEIFLSNIEGEFVNNELIEIEYQDENGNDSIFTERILGFVDAVIVNPNNRGQKYKVGDPAVIYGGFTAENGEKSGAGFKFAKAEVSDTTKGVVKSLTLIKGGYGYRNHPNTLVTVVNDPSDTTGSGALVEVGTVDTAANITLFLPTDTIQPYASVLLNQNPFSPAFPNNALSNINSTLFSCFSYTGIDFYPIQSLVLKAEGQGYTAPPTLRFDTVYQINGTTNVEISSLGYIANIEIITAGSGYANGEVLLFNGLNGPATGYINVSPSGAITSINLTSRGYGYTTMPTVTVQTTSGFGAQLKAYGFNDGAIAALTVDEIGEIRSIAMSNYGFGYVSKPNVSLKVMDVYVNNLSFTFLADSELTVYQGTDIANATFFANVDIGYVSEINQVGFSNATIRLFNYTGVLNTSSALVITETNQHLNPSLGRKIYGNGYAKANLIFVDGTVSYPGYYLNTDGFLSADKKLQDKNKYHNFSYVLESSKQLKEYKQTLFNIVHPIGSELIAHNRLSDVFDQRNIISYTNAISVLSNTAAINSGPEFFPNYYVAGANANLNLSSANTSKLIANGTTNFITLRVNTSTAGITSNDTIIINYDNPDRRIVRTVLNTPSSTILNISQPIIIFGYGYLSTNNSTYVTISENVESKIIANDRIRIFDKADYDVTGNDNHVYVRKVITVTNNLIQLDSTVPISNTNLGYCIDPHLLNAKIKVVREK